MKATHVLASFSVLFLGSVWATAFGCGPASSTPAAADQDSAAPVAPSSAPQHLHTYDEILSTLKEGSRVRVVATYSKCLLDGKPGPNAVGSMNFDTFELFGPGVAGNKKEFFAASENHLIRFGQSFVYDYVRIAVSADQSVEIDVVYLDPKTFEVSVDEKITCKLDDGTNGGGVVFVKPTL
jgi:hypothetical protein